MKWRELFELFRKRTRKEGNWIELFKHFQRKKKKKRTYSSSWPVFPLEIPDIIQPVINDDKHSMLCSISLVEEIRGLVFRMKSHKFPSLVVCQY